MASNYENNLVKALTDAGYPAIRAPASGARTTRDLPDVIAGRHTRCRNRVLSDVLAVELKTTSSTTAYVNREEVEALVSYAYVFGATPLLAVKFKRRGQRSTYHFVRPRDARHTASGNFGLPETDIDDRACMVLKPATKNMPVLLQDDREVFE